ncbi:hypothetical protein ACN3XK_72785 [Actinomadura welshii]
MEGDDRDGSKTRDWKVENPDPERIARSITTLDGARFTEISVTEDEPFRYLSVAGGPDFYLVTGESANGEILQLREPDAGSEQIQLVCGGQMGFFERSSLVARGQAIGAVLEFLRGCPDGFGDAWSID